MGIFYFFAALLVLQSLVSLRGGLRYLRFFRRELNAPAHPFTPYATLFVPCRGLDEGLRENLNALFRQTYPAYEIIFVVDSADDPAVEVIEQLRRAWQHAVSVAARVLVAGRAIDSGQKVHNLIVAAGAADARSEVFVFVDSDARPRVGWLAALVAPLAARTIGATTGYRWFIPPRRDFASQLRAVWNASIASALGENTRANFCWGGSSAVRRETFARLRVDELWRGTLSDDFALTRALQSARLPIRFVPRCLTASHDACDARTLLEFTTRQLKITRVYAPHLWRIVLVSNFLFVAIFHGGLALTLARFAQGLTYALPLALIVSIYALGSAKAVLRLRAVADAFAPEENLWRARVLAAHVLLWPLASALFFHNALAAALSRRLRWRGITYELKSPSETVIIDAARTPEATAATKEHAPRART
ncbi:MAG TPA: glycosyltransferase [Pyrinomonadaceae bacterium]|jgi:cellulose synthase/poly-beta-1,6-N-acetylglucosamine synthase-like glycosyltransferase